MKPSFETVAAIRFGYGLSPKIAPPASVDAMLARLAAPDSMAREYPIAPFSKRALEERALGKLRKARRKKKAGAAEAFRKANHIATAGLLRDLGTSLIRPMLAEDALRERLVRFWADHFTVAAKGKGLRYVTTGYIEEAIRPHVTGSFGTLLKSASLHPAMLIYLDQILSIGPNSVIGKRKDRGLNENLAREVLELHSLGVGGSYTQTDVRQFAKLLTGVYYNFRTGFKYRAQTAEPGAETVLGRAYGGPEGHLADVYAFFDDLAVHPDTARHISHKLAVHFVSDDPDPGLVDAMRQAFVDSAGDLMVTYRAMLEHPAAWRGIGAKAKQPFDFIVSSMRALGVGGEAISALSARNIRRYFFIPLEVMGQPWLLPPGPNGWPEGVEDWITPQGLAARIQWALVASGLLGKGLDPRELARTALGDLAEDRLIFTVGAAESRPEGVALLLSSPEFNRR